MSHLSRFNALAVWETKELMVAVIKKSLIVVYGDIHKQIKCAPMGRNASPDLADPTLFALESEHLKRNTQRHKILRLARICSKVEDFTKLNKEYWDHCKRSKFRRKTLCTI